MTRALLLLAAASASLTGSIDRHCQPGQLDAVPMAFVGLKFYKTASNSLREALSTSVGNNNSYMEHFGLKRYRGDSQQK